MLINSQEQGAHAMTSYEVEQAGERRGGSGLAWLYLPLVLIVFLGGALSVAAYSFSDEPLTIAESLAAGFGGLAGIIIGLIGAVVGVIIALLSTAFGLVVAGGAVGVTLFVIASPIIAIILIAMLMRRQRNACPEPGAHGSH
jgi:hypothetical protein